MMWGGPVCPPFRNENNRADTRVRPYIMNLNILFSDVFQFLYSIGLCYKHVGLCQF